MQLYKTMTVDTMSDQVKYSASTLLYGAVSSEHNYASKESLETQSTILEEKLRAVFEKSSEDGCIGTTYIQREKAIVKETDEFVRKKLGVGSHLPQECFLVPDFFPFPTGVPSIFKDDYLVVLESRNKKIHGNRHSIGQE